MPAPWAAHQAETNQLDHLGDTTTHNVFAVCACVAAGKPVGSSRFAPAVLRRRRGQERA